MVVLMVYHKFFKGNSRSINECSQKDSNVSGLCFKGVLGCFYQKKVSFFPGFQKSWQLPMQTQLDRITLRKHPVYDTLYMILDTRYSINDILCMILDLILDI